MSSFFRAIAIDYEGTLTCGPVPDANSLAALERFRSQSRTVVVVTGRIR